MPNIFNRSLSRNYKNLIYFYKVYISFGLLEGKDIYLFNSKIEYKKLSKSISYYDKKNIFFVADISIYEVKFLMNEYPLWRLKKDLLYYYYTIAYDPKLEDSNAFFSSRFYLRSDNIFINIHRKHHLFKEGKYNFCLICYFVDNITVEQFTHFFKYVHRTYLIRHRLLRIRTRTRTCHSENRTSHSCIQTPQICKSSTHLSIIWIIQLLNVLTGTEAGRAARILDAMMPIILSRDHEIIGDIHLHLMHPKLTRTDGIGVRCT